MPDLLVKSFPGIISEATFWNIPLVLVPVKLVDVVSGEAYKICQMHMSICVKKHIVGLHVAMDDALSVDIS